MVFSNLVAVAIMIAAAATLLPQGITQIDTAAQAAEALTPIAGKWAQVLFTVEITVVKNEQGFFMVRQKFFPRLMVHAEQ
jgi:Mn2+/Fe2+ NRAMP family transporter